MNASPVTAPKPPNTDFATEAIAKLRSAQNFNLAILAGIGAALGGSVLWAIVTVTTQMQLGLMAIAVGYLVGQAIKVTGKGIDKKFGYLGAACSLLGCVLGNTLSAVSFYAQANHLGAAEILNSLDIDFITKLMMSFSQPMDLLFYAIGIYEGYKFSFKYHLAKETVVTSSATQN
jgi:hypothetical protein